MLKIKDDYDLMNLEKYGFYIYINKYENREDYVEIYKIENVDYGLTIDVSTRFIDGLRKINTYSYSRVYFDVIYKMIKDDIIELVEDQISKELYDDGRDLEEDEDYDNDWYSNKILFKTLMKYQYDMNIEYFNIFNIDNEGHTSTEFIGTFDQCIKFILSDENKQMYYHEDYIVKVKDATVMIYLHNYFKDNDGESDDGEFEISSGEPRYIKVTLIKEDK